VSAASIAIASAASTEQTADSLWNSAKTTFNLYNSGSRRSDIDVQISNVKAAQADLVSAKARLAKSLVTAPFTGILTRIDTKVGEVVSASQAPFTMMTDTGFEIESYIPEINISNIKVNDPATVTLDAYGSSVSFDAVVISVDPAETIRDGVSTYRVKIRFKAEDPRIRSGMTANVIITTDKRENILSVPQGIVTEKDSKKFVTVVRGNTETVTEVTTGSISSTGQTEILSGLSAGDVVLLQAP
jgi:HlyD family secretion protein